MTHVSKTLGLALVVAAAFALPSAVQAQVVVVQSAPVYSPPTVVTYSAYPAPVYVAPSISYSAPVVASYSVPRVSYYPAPVVTTYSAPVVTTYAAPVVTYSAPAAGLYTTYTYRNSPLGIVRPKYVSQTYYRPLP